MLLCEINVLSTHKTKQGSNEITENKTYRQKKGFLPLFLFLPALFHVVNVWRIRNKNATTTITATM